MKKTSPVISIAAIVLLLLCPLQANAKGKLKINCKEAIESGLVQKGDTIKVRRYLWGELLPSPIACGRIGGRKVNLKLDSPSAGEYLVELNRLNGDTTRLFEFFISDSTYIQDESYRLSAADGKIVVKHIKGGAENALLSDLSSTISDFLKNGQDPNCVRLSIDSIRQKAEGLTVKDEPALFTYLSRLSLHSRSKEARYIRETIPIGDKRVLYTNFGKKTTDHYLNVIKYNSNDGILMIAEDLIQRADSSLKPHLALQIFQTFREGEIMGQEEVAVKIANKYLLNSNENETNLPYETYFDILAYVRMNENSLVGHHAPDIVLQDTLGEKQRLPLKKGSSLELIFFYAGGCGTCRIVTPLILSILQNVLGREVIFSAIYTGNSKEEWQNERKKFDSLTNPNIKRRDLWDPEIKSNYPMLYGVVSTPQILLLSPEGKILGRRLTPASLNELLMLLKNIDSVR